MTGQELEKKVNIQEAKKQLKLIEETWRKIDYVFQKIGYGQYGNQYLKENILEEKDHDKATPNDVKRFLTVTQAGKLFAVKQLVEYLYTNNFPSLEGYHYCRHSIYTAYSLAKKYNNELKQVLQGIDIEYILKIDYADIQALAY